MGRSPFIGDNPLDSIVLAFEGGYSGYKEYNSPTDPMPIKTMNNNGLQVLEEVPGEYSIYIDKDAVFTTVQKYVVGSYQTFMERKTDVDNSRSLLKSYNIEWTHQDDSDLFIQCNNGALQKLENQPMMLPADGEEVVQPVVLEPRTVPTTYECCFRVGSNGIYIGEGYENLFIVNNLVTPIMFTEINDSLNHYKVAKVGESQFSNNGALNLFFHTVLNENMSIAYEVKNISITNECFIENRVVTPYISYNFLDKKSFEKNSYSFSVGRAVNEMFIFITSRQFTVQQEFEFRKVIITKTSTPKPFVKSVMPTGKLDRISNANETTHTFLNKGDGVVTFGNGYFSLEGDNIQQFLVYKGILTEEQKQIELNKTFEVR